MCRREEKHFSDILTRVDFLLHTTAKHDSGFLLEVTCDVGAEAISMNLSGAVMVKPTSLGGKETGHRNATRGPGLGTQRGYW